VEQLEKRVNERPLMVLLPSPTLLWIKEDRHMNLNLDLFSIIIQGAGAIQWKKWYNLFFSC
jgi:hypothetical protein